MEEATGRARGWLVALAVAAVVAAAVVRTAWLADDAFITLRTIDNWHAGLGLRWNPAERVQVFTHPLWMLLGAAAWFAWRDPHVLCALGVVATVGAVLVLARCIAGARPARSAWLAALLLLSRTFLSYSTSGLENPLTHLLLVGFLAVLWRAGEARWAVPLAALLAALGAVNRLDALLLFAPPLVWAIARAPRPGRALAGALVACLPLLAWELFALLYYGAPLPNTAYAKLATGIPAGALARQGLRYLTELARWDPLTALAIALGLAAAWRGDSLRRAAAVGVLLDVAYVVRVGGDFMAGRFLAAPFVVAVALLADAKAPRARWVQAALVPVPLASLLSVAPGSYPEWLRGHSRVHAAAGIADERAFYYGTTGWLAPRLPLGLAYLEATGLRVRTSGHKVVVESCVGQVGYYAGPEVHLVDPYGLGDPLLARLPVHDPAHWRVGHFERALPEGYKESLESGVNQVRDARLARYLEAIVLITRGPLTAPERLDAIVNLNLGHLDALLADYTRSRKPRPR